MAYFGMKFKWNLNRGAIFIKHIFPYKMVRNVIRKKSREELGMIFPETKLPVLESFVYGTIS